MTTIIGGGRVRARTAVAAMAVVALAGIAVSAAMTQAAVQDTAYTAVTPCVVFDSRTDTGSLAGKFTHDEARTYQVTGTTPANQQGGIDCGVPAGTDAVLINIVAIQADAPGNLRAYATGDTGTGGVVNYTRFATAPDALNNSNAVVIPLSAAGQLDVQNNCGNCTVASAHARGVILGYFDDDLAQRVESIETRLPDADPPCFDNTNRFVDCGNGTVHDQFTGLLWLKDARCGAFGHQTASYALSSTQVAGLANGQCGLTDNSSNGDWRLPTIEEWQAFMTSGCSGIRLPNIAGNGCYSDDPAPIFVNVQSQSYNSSTIDPANTANFRIANVTNNTTFSYGRGLGAWEIWPVRSTR